jgi:hypothetical protein
VRRGVDVPIHRRRLRLLRDMRRAGVTRAHVVHACGVRSTGRLLGLLLLLGLRPLFRQGLGLLLLLYARRWRAR